ncbi:GAF domain-containing protein [Taibaiella chishuiensis]|nr:GAF domain-containing protein [Taibaiella chishuiensis]
MKTQILNIAEKSTHMKPIRSSFSIRPFVDFLREKIASGSTGLRMQQLQSVLDRIMEFEDWDQEISPEKAPAFQELFELIYMTFSAPITDENENVWALAMPFTPNIYFGTNALYRFMEKQAGEVKDSLMSAEKRAEKEMTRLSMIYALIFKKLYGFSFATKDDVIYNVQDEATGQNKYYKVELDSRFVDIEFEGKLPDINFENRQMLEDTRFEAMATIQKFLPLDKFRFSGFSLINVKDITAEHVIEKIKDIIVNLNPGQFVYNDIANALKEIMGNGHLDVMLMPVLKVNDKLVTNCFEGLNSGMQHTCNKYGLPVHAFLEAIEAFTKDPQIIFRKDVAEPRAGEDELFKILREIGVQGVAVLPIYFQKELVGVLSIIAKGDNVLDESLLSAIEPAIPLLEQLLQTTIDDFKITLDNTVKEKFTSLQPAVEWRFNEVAFDYLQGRKHNSRAEVKQVAFPDVYPLYGAIDIRNSTLERNNALKADMQHQLRLLSQVWEKLREQQEMGLISEMIFKTRQWETRIQDFITSDDEFQLNLFFEEEVAPFLKHFRQTHPAAASAIDDYFAAIGPTGEAHSNRRNLEESFQMINQTISNLLEQMNIEIQSAYPCYFEKYRSDGIEYDIYIGQSVTPDKEFHPLYLRNLRLWQLNSMALIAKLTRSLQAQLPKPLQTTQLIFIHANTIDISFRSDEHRFDVEGAYNIRYEMIKKRIDKVLIKGSDERLTQPGKIALVYFQQKDVEEYISHIHFLQSQGILKDEIEYLDLEELQGVNGLKALRVAVALEDEDITDLHVTAEGQLAELSRIQA